METLRETPRIRIHTQKEWETLKPGRSNSLVQRLRPGDIIAVLMRPFVQRMVTIPVVRNWIDFTVSQRSASCGCEITDVPQVSKWNTK